MPTNLEDDPTLHSRARQALVDVVGEAAVQHTERFRRVSNRCPRRVAEAYNLDVAAAMADSDEQVAAKVAAWENANGFEPRDWVAIGREERDEGSDA